MNLLEDLRSGRNNKEMIKMESQVASAVCQRLHDTSGYVLPQFVCKDKPIYFAIDNIDRLIHDPSGKEQFHGTVVTLNQKAYTGVQPMSKPLSLDSKEINFKYEVDMAILSNQPCIAENLQTTPNFGIQICCINQSKQTSYGCCTTLRSCTRHPKKEMQMNAKIHSVLYLKMSTQLLGQDFIHYVTQKYIKQILVLLPRY